MKVSVIYCTARRGGFDILERSMLNQSHTDLEVIVVDELRRPPVFASHIFRSVEPPAKKPHMFWNLSASLNAGVRAATGELIVLLQDYIYVPPDGIEKYVRRAEQERKGVISGIGHQYGHPAHVDIPDGGFSCWKEWPGAPSGPKCFVDPRAEREGFYLCTPVEWEANWGAFPRKCWEEIGGFDEDFDAGWGYDNVNFAERAQMAGYHLFLDTYNEVLCYSHIHLFKEQKVREAAPNNQTLWYRKYRSIATHDEPFRLNYANSIR